LLTDFQILSKLLNLIDYFLCLVGDVVKYSLLLDVSNELRILNHQTWLEKPFFSPFHLISLLQCCYLFKGIQIDFDMLVY